MTEYEKAEAGLLYDAHFDPQVDQGRRRSQELNFEYNALRPCKRLQRGASSIAAFRRMSWQRAIPAGSFVRSGRRMI